MLCPEHTDIGAESIGVPGDEPVYWLYRNSVKCARTDRDAWPGFNISNVRWLNPENWACKISQVSEDEASQNPSDKEDRKMISELLH